LKKYLAVKGTGAKGTQNSALYLGIIHRLDQPVEGLLVFAKTKAAAAHLTKQLESGSLNKQYYATVCGKPQAQEGELVDYLLKEGNLAKIVSQGTPQAKRAVLQYRVLESGDISRLDIHIDTGRFHQIRAQLAHAGWPILGDSKYGTPQSQEISRQQGIRNVALFAYKLEFIHPKTGKKCEYNIS
jgi:23S rRNA pseudouridine1911/1915/1917 synthase